MFLIRVNYDAQERQLDHKNRGACDTVLTVPIAEPTYLCLSFRVSVWSVWSLWTVFCLL